MKILIVEDNTSCQVLLQDILAPYGKCILAADGEEALRAFKKAHDMNEPFDLICMDIMMPNMDGQEALKRIRSLENDLNLEAEQQAVIIMTTAVEDHISIDKAFKDGGASSYLIKPIDMESLLADMKRFHLV